jgi:hypothetical protein
MRAFLIALAGAAAVAACGGDRDETQLAADSVARDIQLPPVDTTVPINDAPVATPSPAPATRPPARRSPSPPPPAATPAPAPAPAPAPPAAAPARASLAAGTTLEASSAVEITSRKNKAGETFRATIAEAVTTSNGQVVIPAGSEVTFTIVQIAPAENKSAKTGTLKLEATSVLINGESRPLDAEVTYIEHTLKGRGVGTSEAAKVGVGAAAGAIIGKVVGGGTGAAAGAVVGAAGGAAVAVETADRDMVIPVGGKIRISLRAPFTA